MILKKNLSLCILKNIYIIHVQDEGLYKLYESINGKYTAIQLLYIIVILNNNLTSPLKLIVV